MTYQPPSDYTTQGRHWTDLNTGCVYQLDEDETSPTYGEYYLVSCPTPGPPGPPGPSGGAGFSMGSFTYKTTRGTPASGEFRLGVNPVAGGANTLNVSDTQKTGENRDPYLSQVQQGDTLFADDGAGNLVRIVVDGPPVDHGTWWEFPFRHATPLAFSEPPNNSTVEVLLDATGGGFVPDTTAPAIPGGLVVETGTVLQTDGSLRPFLRGTWAPNSEADFAYYDAQVAV